MSGNFHVCLGSGWFFSTCLAFPQNIWAIQIVSRKSRTTLDSLDSFRLKTFRIVWKLSRLSGQFSDRLDTFPMCWKLSGLSRNLTIFLGFFSVSFLSGHILVNLKFPDYLETLWLVCKLFMLSISFFCCHETLQSVWNSFISNCLGTLQMFWKPLGLSGNLPKFLDFCLDTFWDIWKFSRLLVNFQYCLQAFQVVFKLSWLFESFPVRLESCQIIW